MQSFVVVGAMLASAIASVAAAPAPATPATPAGVVRWDINRNQAHPRLLRRSSKTGVSATLVNNVTQAGYFVTVKVGTPGQTLTLQIDTGSSDTWVPEYTAEICEVTDDNDGCYFGSFDPSSSSTFEVIDEDGFKIQYVDGTGSSGDYFVDTFVFGGAKIKNLTMGLGKDTTVNFGLVGIGYTSGEAIVGDGIPDDSYANLPVAMVDANLINSVAFSLWLNDLDASSGNILFGGIDTAKYKGHLTILDVLPGDDVNYPIDFRVAMTSLEATSLSGSDTLTSEVFPIPVVLDSGTTLSFLPDDLAKQVWKEAGAHYEPIVGMAMIACSQASSGGTFTFGFGGPGGASISVGMDELVLDFLVAGHPYFTDGLFKGEDACAFGIQNSSVEDTYYLLGDTFLRSAYVVYDVSNNQIGIAETDFNTTDSSIVLFTSDGAEMPVGAAAPSQTSLVTPAVTIPAYAAASGFGAVATTTAAGSSGSTDKPKTKNAAGAIAVPTGLLQTGVISAIIFVAGGMLLL